MDVVLQTAVLGVGLLQPVLHVLQLSLVAALHLQENRLEKTLTCWWLTSDLLLYLLFASLQLTLLSLSPAQLALQVQRFGLRRSLLGQNLLHVGFHLQEERACISDVVSNRETQQEVCASTCLWASSRVFCSCLDRTLHSNVFSSSCFSARWRLTSFEARDLEVSSCWTFKLPSFLKPHSSHRSTFVFGKNVSSLFAPGCLYLSKLKTFSLRTLFSSWSSRFFCWNISRWVPCCSTCTEKR